MVILPLASIAAPSRLGMSGRLAAAILTLACAAFAQRPELGQLDASPTLFTVMAAINAAGLDEQIDSPNNHPLRKAIRDELAKKIIPSLVPIKAFFAKHPQLAPYISFAITSDGDGNTLIQQNGTTIEDEPTANLLALNITGGAAEVTVTLWVPPAGWKTRLTCCVLLAEMMTLSASAAANPVAVAFTL